jgi:hypothetical protein
MKTIRRLYFYAVALVSLEIVLWGLISLIRTSLAGNIIPGADTLAQALALILVGVPVFLFHWLWIQRNAAKDEEEHGAMLRAVFLYGTLLITLIPAVQNGLALINRLLLQSSAMNVYRALLGTSQSWKDNVIAIIFNLIAAAYFYRILQFDWMTLKENDNFSIIRRIYRYTWLVYSLFMTVFGAQQIIRFMFYPPTNALGGYGLETFVNGLALLVIGTPIWVASWNICQGSLSEPAERGSLLRLAVLYALALAGVITVISSAGIILDLLLRLALGEPTTWTEFVRNIGGPLSILIPLAVVWAYYGRWLNIEIQAVSDTPRRAGMKRLYYYILSLIGLVAAFIGLALLVSVVIDQVTTSTLWGTTLRSRIAAAISTLVAGLPLWIAAWRPMQAEALASGDAGDHARRSLVRKSYLYLVIFASVIGAMSSAIALVYNLLSALLGSSNEYFFSNILNAIQLLVLFAGLLLYHLGILRYDNARSADSLVAKQNRFRVVVIDPGDRPFVIAITSAIQKQTPGMPLAIQSIGEPFPEEASDAQAVVMPAALALDPPEALRLWLDDFTGTKMAVAGETPGWVWSGQSQRPLNGSAQQAALALRQLAEGQEVRSSGGTSAGMIVLYILAVLFGVQILFGLAAFLISAFIG